MAEGKDEEPSRIGMHTYRPFLLEYSLMAELHEVHRRAIPGVYINPSATTPLVWFGMLVVRSGFYAGGLFKFVVVMSDNHPHAGAAPTVLFQPPVFHPLVDMVTGEMNCAVHFPKWTAQVNSLAELLEFVKDSFYQIQTDGSVNPEASLLFTRNMLNFQQRANESVQYCRSRLLDPLASTRSSSGDIGPDVDPHTFPTGLLEGEALEEAKRKMMSGAAEGGVDSRCSTHDSVEQVGSATSREDSELLTTTYESITAARKAVARRGLSWVKPGTAVPFSRKETG